MTNINYKNILLLGLSLGFIILIIYVICLIIKNPKKQPPEDSKQINRDITTVSSNSLPSTARKILLIDDDGNIITVPISDLQNSITTDNNSVLQTIFTDIQNNTNAIKTNQDAISTNKNRFGDYMKNGQRVAIRSAKQDGCDGNSKYLMNGCGNQFNINGKWYSAALMDPSGPSGTHTDDHTWYIQTAPYNVPFGE